MENENRSLECWSDAERWVWQEIMAGRPANLDLKYEAPEALDTKKIDGWDDQEKSRALSQKFIDNIFTSISPRRPRRIAISGAWFPELLDCTFKNLDVSVWLDHCRFENGIDCHRCEVDGNFILRECFISGAARLERARFNKTFRFLYVYITGEAFLGAVKAASDIYIDGCEIQGALNLASTHVEGDLSLRTSTVHGPVDANRAKIDSLLTLDDAIFAHNVDFKEIDAESIRIRRVGHPPTFLGEFSLRDARIGRSVDIIGSRFQGAVNLNGIQCGNWLAIRGSAFRKPISITNAKIGTGFYIDGDFKKEIDCRSTWIGSEARLRGVFEGLVSLSAVRIENSFELSDSNVHSLNLNGCSIGGSVFLTVGHSNIIRSRVTGVFEGPVFLTSVRIESNLIIDGDFQSNVHSLHVDSCSIVGNVLLGGARFSGAVSVIACDIGNVHLSSARFSKNLDMGGTRIAGELRLGSEVHAAAEWADDAELILRGARAGVLQDRLDRVEGIASDAWPRKLQIINFTYERLGGTYGGGESDMQRRDVRWYSGWLNRDQSYSPQPYEHLARVLRDTGDPQKANAILYAGRERARKEARKRRQFGRWFGLTMLNLTMGYGLGYRYFRVVWWLIAITLVGALVLAKSMPVDKLDIPAWLTSAPIAVVASSPESGLLKYDLSDLFFASLDQLLPIVELDKSRDQLFSAGMLPRWSRYWFYAQSIFGYVLGSFLVAGLAGLTQKN